MTQLPNAGPEYDMRISSNTEVEQIVDGLASTIYRDYSLQCQTPEYLRNLKIKEVRSM